MNRLLDALIDPARRERTALLLFAGYAAVWSIYAAISKGSQDIHTDMAEMVAWSHHAAFGNPKHPPLGSWLVGAWFSVMPMTDAAYYVFAIILVTIALWIAWRVSAPYLTADKRVAGLAFLTFVPFFNFHAIKFNADTLLIPLWAATTWAFLLSLREPRGVGLAVLAGVGAAAAMLGKYSSVFLLASLLMAALVHPQRDIYFRSFAPWIAIIVGAALLAPHAIWLAGHDFAPFQYALDTHPATYRQGTLSAIHFIGGTLAFIAVPIIVTAVAARPGAAATRDILWPAAAERTAILVVFAAPLLLFALSAALLPAKITPLWSMPALTLLPIVLLSSPAVKITRAATVRLLTAAILWPLVALALSPAVAIFDHRNGVKNYGTHYRLMAQAVQRTWARHATAPLKIVASTDIAYDIVFYLPAGTLPYDIQFPHRTPWIDKKLVEREGVAILCPEPSVVCLTAARPYGDAPRSTQETVTLSRDYFGSFDVPVRYHIIVVPPQI